MKDGNWFMTVQIDYIEQESDIGTHLAYFICFPVSQVATWIAAMTGKVRIHVLCDSHIDDKRVIHM